MPPKLVLAQGCGGAGGGELTETAESETAESETAESESEGCAVPVAAAATTGGSERSFCSVEERVGRLISCAKAFGHLCVPKGESPLSLSLSFHSPARREPFSRSRVFWEDTLSFLSRGARVRGTGQYT